MVLNVSLFNIAGLGNTPPGDWGPLRHQTTFASCAVSSDGGKAYFGRAGSVDPQMRNLVVASLDSSGGVVGVPRCYPSSAWPLDPIVGYRATGEATGVYISAILVDGARRRLYMAEIREATPPWRPTASGLNVYTLDPAGEPVGQVRTHPSGNAPHTLLLHPTQPVLYMAGGGMLGVAVQKLDADGEPTDTPKVCDLGSYEKVALGISADAILRAPILRPWKLSTLTAKAIRWPAPSPPIAWTTPRSPASRVTSNSQKARTPSTWCAPTPPTDCRSWRSGRSTALRAGP
jgi:hypothetical protein